MKQLIIFALMGAGMAAAQDQTPAPQPAVKKTVARKKTTPVAAKAVANTAAKPAAKTPQPLTIPTDAVSNPDGTYSWTDKAGKKWTFNRTPFGISKTEVMGPAADTPREQAIQSTDMGATVKFSKPSPFGAMTWEKKKSELTDEERTIFQSQHPDNHQ